MVFSGRNSSIDILKSSSLSRKEKKTTNNLRQKIRPKSPLIITENEVSGRQAKTGPKCKASKESAIVFPQSSYVEDVAFDQQNIGKERWFDDSESLWLSSDATSTSSFFEEHRLSSPFHLSVDRQTIPWLANLADTYLSLGEGITFLDEEGTNSTVDPEKILQEDPKEEIKITNKSQNSDRNASADSTIDILPSVNSSTDPDCYSPISDTDKNSFLHPLMSEDSKWVSDSEVDRLSNSTTKGVEDGKSQNDSSLEQASEVAEPLFWPFEWKFDWSSQDIYKCFAMSPPQKQMTDSKLAYRMQLHDKKRDLGDVCRRRLDFNKEEVESDELQMEQGPNNNNKIVRRVNSMPSTLRKSNELAMKVVRLEMEGDTMEAADRKGYSPNSVHTDRELASNQELPIETILGLGEFDGQEGIDFEFTEDIFSMDDSL